jgi:hypothetical protein
MKKKFAGDKRNLKSAGTCHPSQCVRMSKPPKLIMFVANQCAQGRAGCAHAGK